MTKGQILTRPSRKSSKSQRKNESPRTDATRRRDTVPSQRSRARRNTGRGRGRGLVDVRLKSERGDTRARSNTRRSRALNIMRALCSRVPIWRNSASPCRPSALLNPARSSGGTAEGHVLAGSPTRTMLRLVFLEQARPCARARGTASAPLSILSEPYRS